MSWTSLWHGKVTEELKELYIQYEKLFSPFYPDNYAEIDYEGYQDMTYDEYVGYIKECIKQKKEMPDIVYGEDDDEE